MHPIQTDRGGPVVRTLQGNKEAENMRYFPSSTHLQHLGLAEHLSPLRQLLACEDKTDGHPPPAQCGHLIHSWVSLADTLYPLIEKTSQRLDKSLAEWPNGHRDTVQQAPHLTNEEKLRLPLSGAPKEPFLS